MLRTRQEWFDYCMERGTSGDQVLDILADWAESEKSNWVMWKDRQPHEGEAALVIFYNGVYRKHTIQVGSIVHSDRWMDYEPVAWMPFPEMPTFIQNPITHPNGE